MPEKSLADSTVLALTEAQIWLAETTPTGFLVALWLDPETAKKLAIPGGEPAESLHITVAYCGDAAEMGELLQARGVTAVDDAVRYWNAPKGTIAGYGRFNASESSDGKDVFYATPDLPELSRIRHRVIECLSDNGIAVSTNHGYVPHITLSYLDSGAATPEPAAEDIDLEFSAITIMIGDRRIDIPFWVDTYPEATIAMSDEGQLPLEALIGSKPVRQMLGDFTKEWIPFLPKPGNYTHSKYGEMNLTTTAYEEMLRNFDAYVFKQDLPIRATHMPQDGGAVGWIKRGGMRMAGDGSLEVKPEWNELGKGLVDGDRFKYVSAEFCKEWTNPVTLEVIPNVAVGLALVTRPHFKTDVLNPLSECEAHAFSEAADESFVFTEAAEESGDPGKGTEMPEEQKIVAADETKVAEATAAALTAELKSTEPTTAPLQNIVLSDLTTVVLTAEQRRVERQRFEDLSLRVELAERSQKRAESELETLKRERRVERYTAEVTGHSAENGNAWFGEIQANVEHLVSLAESHGDDSPQVRWAVTQKRNEAQAIRNTGLFDPISLSQAEDGQSVTSQVAFLAEQLMSSDKSLTRDQAVVKAYEKNPELYTKGLRR